MLLWRRILVQQWLKYLRNKVICVGHWAHVKKLLVQVEDSITNFEPSLQDKISQQNILGEKLNTLKGLDGKIFRLLDENEHESIEHEVAEANKITDEITGLVVCIDSTLKSLQINSPIHWWKSKLQSQSGLLLNGAIAALNVKICTKLPKLELKRFNGRPREWQAFMDCFDSAVHWNSKLGNVEKTNYNGVASIHQLFRQCCSLKPESW